MDYILRNELALNKIKHCLATTIVPQIYGISFISEHKTIKVVLTLFAIFKGLTEKDDFESKSLNFVILTGLLITPSTTFIQKMAISLIGMAVGYVTYNYFYKNRVFNYSIPVFDSHTQNTSVPSHRCIREFIVKDRFFPRGV